MPKFVFSSTAISIDLLGHNLKNSLSILRKFKSKSFFDKELLQISSILKHLNDIDGKKTINYHLT